MKKITLFEVTVIYVKVPNNIALLKFALLNPIPTR